MPKQQSKMEGSWEELVSAGVTAKEMSDNSAWVIGDLAVKVSQLYGSDALEKFATDINVSKATIKRYRSVSMAWKPSDRIGALSHRHHMLLTSREDKKEWLERAADESWSVENLRIHLKKLSMDIPETVKVGSILFRRDEWEHILKWFALCIDNPELFKKMDKMDNEIVTKIKNKVTKLIEMEKSDYEVVK